ncbi:hypothetical protein HDV02_006068 [Globomyces sp. JEL0801]|nr:hypothetical protein HDV02_006068 [Globomyces sp. JEL0801]
MHEFAQRKKGQDSTHSNIELRKAIAYILTFMFINIAAFILILLAVFDPWTETFPELSTRLFPELSTRLLDIAFSSMTYQLIVYSMIFDAIKGIKFQNRSSGQTAKVN